MEEGTVPRLVELLRAASKFTVEYAAHILLNMAGLSMFPHSSYFDELSRVLRTVCLSVRLLVSECRAAIRKAGGMEALVKLVSGDSEHIQREATGALWNLTFQGTVFVFVFFCLRFVLAIYVKCTSLCAYRAVCVCVCVYVRVCLCVCRSQTRRAATPLCLSAVCLRC